MDNGRKELRIGTGFDVHRLVEGRDLILGGVNIPWKLGLEGHSDADVLTHAIMDAILGAAALPDIGNLFPDNSDEFKDIYSLKLLERVTALIEKEGWKIVNVDSTVICQEPKLLPHIHGMRECLAESMKIDISRVNVKATTTERLGFTGRGEGIAAEAVALLETI